MGSLDELAALLKKLRMSGILETLDLRIREAVDDEVAHTEFLVRLLRDEVERRGSKQMAKRIRKANFEHAKTLADFDFLFNPTVPKAKVINLATCAFISRQENLLLLGQTGVGKSHLAQAIGHRACRSGRTVLFMPTHEMFRELRSARADGSTTKWMQRYLNVDLLILDDLGLYPLVHTDPMDLYEIVRGRYERGSIIITSNRDVSELLPMFPDQLLGSAAVDRLLHHAHILRLTGRSYRTGGNQTETAA